MKEILINESNFHEHWQYVRQKLGSRTDNYWEIKAIAQNLKGFEKKYYEYLPVVCWKTERNQAKDLRVSRDKIQTVKRKLIKKGLIVLKTEANGKRLNPKHLLLKTLPIILDGKGQEFYRYEPADDGDTVLADYLQIDQGSDYSGNIDWALLERYTAEDINCLSKLEKIRLYMNAGFLVLPTHYPIFTPLGVRCSCKRKYSCKHKGKHPRCYYRHITPRNYENYKEKFYLEFLRNPDLNIGFKVSGFSVLDVDFRYDGHRSLELWRSLFGFEIKGLTSCLSGNGRHIYCDDKNLSNTSEFHGYSGLDMRSENGFIMAPDSRHHSGKYYEWQTIGELATLPEELTQSDVIDDSEIDTDYGNRATVTTEKLKAILAEIKLPRELSAEYSIKEGKRGLTLFKWASRFRGAGSGFHDIYNQLRFIRDTYCEEGDEPVLDGELAEIAADVVKRYPPNSEMALAR